MFSDMDDKALMSSEVFRELLKNADYIEEKSEPQLDSNEVLDNFLDLQKKVNASSVLKNRFKQLQERFINDPDYRDTVNDDFVQGVLLLKLD